jgi:hypothetical protein
MNLEALCEARRVVASVSADELDMHNWCSCALHHMACDGYFQDEFGLHVGGPEDAGRAPRMRIPREYRPSYPFSPTHLIGTSAGACILDIHARLAAELFSTNFLGYLNVRGELPNAQVKELWLEYVDQMIAEEERLRRQAVIDALNPPRDPDEDEDEDDEDSGPEIKEPPEDKYEGNTNDMAYV